MDIADVKLIRTRQHTFRDRMIARYNEVISRHVQLFYSERHEGEILTKHPSRKWQVLYEGSSHWPSPQKSARLFRQEVDNCEQSGIRKAFEQLFDDAFRACISF